MEAVLDAHAEMASFLTPFRKAHCMHRSPHTPPSSPDSNCSSKHIGPRLHLSKFLYKGDKHSPRRSKRTLNGATSPQSGAKGVSISPFRAVTEMKEPFPLILPDSPALTDESSPREDKQQLRRVSASYSDLRALAEAQTVVSASRLNTPLLPSPMFRQGDDGTEASSYFAYPKRKDTPPPEVTDDDEPYENRRIISGYCKVERWSLLLDEISQSKQASQLKDASSPWTKARTPSKNQQPLTPSSKQTKRDRTDSAESDWLANTTSHEERVRRFKQRCFQVVQHPGRKNAPQCTENEDQVMLATVLVGPGKPKLVQIRRPPPGSRSSQSRSSQAGATTDEEDGSPSTPTQRSKEVSAFSPYDTPCQRTYGAMTPMIQLLNSSESVQKLRPAPLSITPRTTMQQRTDSAVFVHDDKDHEDAFRQADSQSTLPSSTFPSILRSPRRHTTRPTSHLKIRQRQLETAIDMITSAIDAFPCSLLHLDSPVVRQLRNTSIASHAYISPLQNVFPSASPLLLSALAAWCLVDAYLGAVDLSSRRRTCRSSTTEEQQQRRYRDICAASNESLHRIPHKARRMLGIRGPDVVVLRLGTEQQQRALEQRARFVRISVGVIAQRLMEAVKGGWVEELWRACGVIVRVVDGGGYQGDDGADEEGEDEEEWV